jgi:hypothetical protein
MTVHVTSLYCIIVQAGVRERSVCAEYDRRVSSLQPCQPPDVANAVICDAVTIATNVSTLAGGETFCTTTGIRRVVVPTRSLIPDALTYKFETAKRQADSIVCQSVTSGRLLLHPSTGPVAPLHLVVNAFQHNS